MVLHVVEVGSQVDVDDARLAMDDGLGDAGNRLVRASLGTVAIAAVWKSASKIGSRMGMSAPCTTRSRMEGIDRTRTLPPSSGISFLRLRMGRYCRDTSSSRIRPRKTSTPPASMASNVTPSLPGAPFAARRLAHRPEDGFVDRLQVIDFSPPAIQATGLLAVTPAGLTPAERASLRWTHIGPVCCAARSAGPCARATPGCVVLSLAQPRPTTPCRSPQARAARAAVCPMGVLAPPTPAPRTAMLAPALSSSASLHQPAAQQQCPHSAYTPAPVSGPPRPLCTSPHPQQ